MGALALVVVTCTDLLTGPRRPASARIALAPAFSSEANRILGRLASFSLNVNTVRLVITRPLSEVLKDTIVTFPANATSLSIALTVDLQAAEETLRADVELRDNDVVLFRGTQDVLAKRGQTTGGGNDGTPITLTYDGPGKGATTLTIAERSPTLVPGASIQLTATAADAQGQPVTDLPLSWSSSAATTLTLGPTGLATSVGGGGTALARVEGLNGIEDSVPVTILVPSQLTIIGGNGQKDTVNKQLAAPLVVLLADAARTPIPGATIDWTITSGAASFSGTSAVTTTSSQTNVAGAASVALWLGQTAGEVMITAIPRNTALVATLRDTAVTAGPAGLVIAQAPSDTVRSSLPFVRQPKVQVVDGFNNPIASPDWVVVGSVAYDTPTSCLPAAAPGPVASPLAPSLTRAPTPTSVRAPDLSPTLAKLGVRPNVRPTRAPRMVPAPPPARAAMRARLEQQASRRLPGGMTLQSLRERSARGSATRTSRRAPAPLRRSMTATPGAPRTAVASAASTCPYAATTGEVNLATDASGLAAFTDLRVIGYVGDFNYRLVFYAYDTTGVNPTVYSDSTPIVVRAGPPGSVYQFAGYDYVGARYDSDTAYTTPGNPRWFDYYVGGTLGPTPKIGTDTVSVIVSDSIGNPVISGNVRWALQASGGTIDSTQSALDTNGVARAGTWTPPTALGAYRMYAHVDEWADSLEFTTVTEAATAYDVEPISGYDQAGLPGSPLPQPVVVRVRDQYEFPLPGAAVSWSVISGTGRFSAPTSTSDATGVASNDYTLSSVEGQSDVVAAMAGSYSLYMYETIPAAGWTRRWIGAATLDPTAWDDPLNWAPAGVPTASDNVWLSATTYDYQPSLAADAAVNTLQTDAYASLSFNGKTLTAGGDVAVRTTGLRDSGNVVLTGANPRILLASSLPSLTVTNGATVFGFLQVYGDLAVTGGLLDMDTTQAYVANAFSTSGTGALKMTAPQNYLSVGGDATFGGGSTAGLLTTGTLYVGGSLKQLKANSPSSFQATGANYVVLNDTGTATVSFEDWQSSRFATLEVVNTSPGGTQFTTPVNVDSLAYFGSAVRASGAGPMTVGGRLQIGSGADLSGLSSITLTGSKFPLNTGVGPQLLRLTGTIPTVGVNDYTGSVAVDSGGSLSVDGQLRVRGDFSVQGKNAAGSAMSVVSMPTATSQLTIDGNAVFDGGDESSLLLNGVVSVGGNFTQKNSLSSLSYAAASSALKTVFNGSGTQSVGFASPDPVNGSRFGAVDVTNVSLKPVILSTSVFALGDVQVVDPSATGLTAWLQIDPSSVLTMGAAAAIRLHDNSHFTLNGDFSGACYYDNGIVFDGSNVSKATANCVYTGIIFSRNPGGTPIRTSAPRAPTVNPTSPKRD